MIQSILIAALFLPLSRPAQEGADLGEAAGLGPIRSVRVLGLGARSPRGPVHVDPLEHALATGTFHAPEAGAALTLADGSEATWRKLESADGLYEDEALRNGWVHARVESSQPQVLMLEARGHSFVLVDGTPRYGDPYSLGITRTPIAIAAGGSDLLFKVSRGALAASLAEVPAEVFLEQRDLTLPDFVRGRNAPSQAGVLVVNATASEKVELLLNASVRKGDETGFLSSLRIPRLGPFESRKVALPLPMSFEVDPDVQQIDLTLMLTRVDPEDASQQLDLHEIPAALRVRKATEVYKQTFRSAIDDSAQYYAVREAVRDEDSPPNFGLALSLHGAGVEATGQAASYSDRNWLHVLAPTNRRPFGFDWEDWGRTDAIEALMHATRRLRIDPGRIYLTGHSMGGHGTWNLGATLPGMFAAIGPSAGWSDFWSYTGAWEPDRESAVERMLARASNPSRTSKLAENLAPIGVYVLHGDADDNVPVREARAMRELLQGFHRDFEYHEEPGAGHWWGARCVDWQPMFDFFLRHRAVPDGAVREIDFRTYDPAIASRMNWFFVEQQANPLKESRVQARLIAERRNFDITTRNIIQFRLELMALATPVFGQPAPLERERPFNVTVDGQPIEITWPPGATMLRMSRNQNDGAWNAMGEFELYNKGPHRGGSFKTVFDRRMVFVHGTQGTPEENAWAHSKARFDAETWRYRANGQVEIVADVDFTPAEWADRNVIVYGHSKMVSGLRALLATGEFEVEPGRLRVGDKTIEREDLGFLACFPRKGSDTAKVGIVAGTGPVGMRSLDHVPYFTSGVGLPDWTVLSADTLLRGADGVLGAGFFGNDWTVGGGDQAWHRDLK